MKWTRQENGATRMAVVLNGEVLEHLKYLGATIPVNISVEVEVCNKSRGLKAIVKRELYERIIIPTMIYGSEVWGRS